MKGFSTKMGLKQWGYLGTIPEEMYLITHNLTESGTPWPGLKLTRLNKKAIAKMYKGTEKYCNMVKYCNSRVSIP